MEGKIKGISKKTLDGYKSKAHSTNPYSKLENLMIDFKKSLNLYKVRNPIKWENEIQQVSSMLAYACIIDLV